MPRPPRLSEANTSRQATSNMAKFNAAQQVKDAGWNFGKPAERINENLSSAQFGQKEMP